MCPPAVVAAHLLSPGSRLLYPPFRRDFRVSVCVCVGGGLQGWCTRISSDVCVCKCVPVSVCVVHVWVWGVCVIVGTTCVLHHNDLNVILDFERN